MKHEKFTPIILLSLENTKNSKRMLYDNSKIKNELAKLSSRMKKNRTENKSIIVDEIHIKHYSTE